MTAKSRTLVFVVPLALLAAAFTVALPATAGAATPGAAVAWGDNYYGQLGNGTNTTSNVPVPVSGITDAVAIAGGLDHSLALRSDGTVWAWGDNFNGQLGNGTNKNRRVPVRVSGL